MTTKTLKEILDLAIKKEDESYSFYMDLHKKTEDPSTGETLLYLAGEEKKHREFLEKYRSGEFPAASLRPETVTDYKIAEHTAEPEISGLNRPGDIYLAAAHRELAAWRLYTSLAELEKEGEVREMLLRIAGEEMKHKEKVEYLYANTAFTQTSGG